MNLFEVLFSSLLIVWLYVTVIWLISLAKNDSGIMDIAWGIGFFLINYYVYWSYGIGIPRQLLLWLMVMIWGFRLSWHIGRRNMGKPEDWRYAKWRAEEGKRWWWYSYFKVFLLQGAVMWVVSLPIVLVQMSPLPDGFSVWDYLGMALWIIGFVFEAWGDRQLRQFKKNPQNAGRVLETGLWKYTRHPNYFGESVLWWGFFSFAVSVGAWWTVVAPLLMTWLLLKVSGVAMLEKGMIETKPKYAAYIQRTSAFFPMPPKKRDE